MKGEHDAQRHAGHRFPLLHFGPDMVRWLQKLVVVKDHEASTCLHCFAAFYFVLTSYFLLLPFREEAGISVGTDYLPLLFMASLVLTVLVAPFCSSYLAAHPGSREQALKRLFKAFAVCFTGFYALYFLADSSHVLNKYTPLLRFQTQPQPQQQQQPAIAIDRPLLTAETVTAAAAAAAAGELPAGATPAQQRPKRKLTHTSLPQGQISQAHLASRQAYPTRSRSPLSPTHSVLSESGDVLLPQTPNRSTANRKLTAEASTTSATHSEGSGAGGTAPARMPPSALPHPPAPVLTRFQMSVRACFYVWLNLQNIVAISAMWARCADLFNAEEGSRLFGFISSGATLGQLTGSLLSMAISSYANRAQSGGKEPKAAGEDAQQLHPLLLVSAGAMFLAAHLVARTTPPVKPRGSPEPCRTPPGPRTPPSLSHHPMAVHTTLLDSPLKLQALSTPPTKGGATSLEITGLSTPPLHPGGQAGGAGKRVSLRSMAKGFGFIWKSPYLRLICGYMLVSNLVGSLLYFLRALVVSSQVHDSGSRTAFFATINSYSAAIIALLQLFATGSILTTTGISGALLMGPVAALGSCALIGLTPSTTVLASTEVARKVLQYSVTRPAREVLFTVTSLEEKYQAKLCIDTVVLRLGDAIAASMFHIVDWRLKLGLPGVAVLGWGMGFVWLLLAGALGAGYSNLSGPGAVGGAGGGSRVPL